MVNDKARRLRAVTLAMRVHSVTASVLVALSLAATGCGTAAVPSVSRQTDVADGLQSLAPIAEGAEVEPAGWSPSGEWLPFWTVAGSPAGTSAATVLTTGGWRYPLAGAALRFVNTNTGRVCNAKLTRRGFTDKVFWQPDGRAVVRVGGALFGGSPCGPFTPASAPTYALPTPAPGQTAVWDEMPPSEGIEEPGPEDSAPSPDGTMVVTTVYLGDTDDNMMHYETTITRKSDGRELASLEWQVGAAFGDRGTGGDWLPDGRFLIWETMPRGPLLLAPDGTVTEVVPTLFGTSMPNGGGEYLSLGARAVTGPGGDGYHILLSGSSGAESEFPPPMVYHSETSKAETIPARAFAYPDVSQDGRWLFVTGYSGADGNEYAIWVRDVEAIGGPFRPIADSDAEREYAVNDGTIVFVDESVSEVQAVRLSDLAVTDRWDLGPWVVDWLSWSPDGKSIAILGRRTVGAADTQSALFVVSGPAR